MSILNSVKGWLSTAESHHTKQESAGAYWCDDCGLRLRETAVESDTPRCPDCDEEMRFERSMQGIHCC